MPRARNKTANVKRRRAFALIIATFVVALSSFYILGSTFTYADRSKSDNVNDKVKSENSDNDNNKNDDRVTPFQDRETAESHIIVIPDTPEKKSEDNEKDIDKEAQKKDSESTSP